MALERYSSEAAYTKLLELIEDLVSKRSTTTALGTNQTLIDSALTEGNDYWNGSTILILSGACIGQSREIIDFVAATDTLWVSPAFDAVIQAGVDYVILPPRALEYQVGQIVDVEAEAGSILARLLYIKNAIRRGTGTQIPNNVSIYDVLGAAQGSALGSIYNILGNPATALATRIGNPDAHTLTSLVTKFGDLGFDLWTILGYQGATSLHNKLTLARAILLDNLANLDATISSRALEDGGRLQNVETDVNNAWLILKLTSDVVVDAIALAGNQNTTELTITLPTIAGATIMSAMVACFLTAINKTATAHQIDVTVQGRVAVPPGAWNNYFAALDYIGFPTVQNATCGDVPVSNVTALVNTWGATYGFRLTVNQSGGAFNVRYKTQYVLIIMYRMS